MTHHAKAVSAGSTEAGGNSRRLFRRALATRGVSRDAEGSGARSNGRLRATFAVLALAIAAFAVTAAPALAAPPSTQMETVSNVSYTSAHVSGKVATDGSGGFGLTAYGFQISTDNATWSTAVSSTLSGAATKTVEADITGLKGATKYFVRLVANNGFFIGAETPVPSSLPNPSFTTLTVDPPTIPGTVAATEIFSLSAKATGKVKRPANADPAFNVECRFEYITNAQYEENVNVNSLPGFQGATPAPCEQNPITAPNAEPEVSAHLTGLSSATSYRLRLVAENGAPGAVVKEAAGTFTTAVKVAKPTVLATADAAEVGQNSAKVSGEVQRPAGDDPALDVNCNFEYVTEEQFTATNFAGAASTPCTQNPVTKASANGEGKQAVSAELFLIPETTYHLRLSAENTGGTDSKEAAHIFTTPPALKPAVTIDPVASGTYTTAEVSGTLEALGDRYVVWRFEKSGDGGANWSQGAEHGAAPFEDAFPGSGPHVIKEGFGGLQPNTTYLFRISAYYYIGLVPDEVVARHEMAFTPAPNPSITTEPLAAPTATLNPITTFTANTAHLSANVDPHAPAGPLNQLGKKASATEWRIECTPECPGPGGEPFSGTIQGEEGAQSISRDAVSLQPNTYYEVKLLAHNEVYSVETPLQTFQTPLILPTVKAEAGASDGEGGYFLQGIVNSNNTKVTSCVIEYGTTATYPNTYQASCLPNPSGPDEVQNIGIDASEGQFKLGFRGQTTGDLPFNATTTEVQTALRALSQVGPAGVNVTGSPGAYVITFAGKLAGANVEPIKVSDGTTPLGGGGGASVSTATEGGRNHPVTIEAHVENLTIDAHYHFRIFATNAAGSTSTVDREFVPTLAPPRPGCENEQLRNENSSEALPECRAYEMVSPPNKDGYDANLGRFNGGVAVAYKSAAGNIANSGTSSPFGSIYVAARSPIGWETIPNLNGPTGSLYSPPVEMNAGDIEPTPVSLPFSADLRSSVWGFGTKTAPPRLYLRNPDGHFSLIAEFRPEQGGGPAFVGASDDLSHLVYNAVVEAFNGGAIQWSVLEFAGSGNLPPHRVDVDNSDTPISTCLSNGPGRSVSSDGRVIVFAAIGGCGAPNPPADEIWARVGGTTSYDASASQCNRTAPAAPCNAPASSTFQGTAKDGSRVFFTTTQQLLNGDTDETNDLYACDIPTAPQAPVGTANPCSALHEVSAGIAGNAQVQEVLSTSADGSTIYFTAKGVLADNTDAFGEEAVAGDNNLYVWRTDAAHPAGQTTFVTRLTSSAGAQITPDGRYVVLTTATPLLPTDTDNGADVYRYDAVAGEMIRASTGPTGTGGNADGFDAAAASSGNNGGGEAAVSSAISDDGQKIVFTTAEPLVPTDGNGEPDVYLWTPQGVRLISSGSGPALEPSRRPAAAIDGSGQDIYFESAAQLTPADGDEHSDIYDARVGGGFSFAEKTCSGESCQPQASKPPVVPGPSTGQLPADPGNVKPCPKGKIAKGDKCVKKKTHKKHGAKKHHGKKQKRAGSNRGGGK